MTSWTAPEIHRTEALHEHGDELSSLREFLQWHRDTLISKCSGLTGEQLMLKAVPTSQLTLLGLVRHLAEVERWWFRRSFGQDKELGNLYCTDEYEDGDFDLAAAEGAEADFVTYFREVELADAVGRACAGRRLPRPDGPLHAAVRLPPHDRGVRAAQRARRPAA